MLNAADNRIIDLHLHSSISDGLLSPSELVGLANKYRLRAIAIADHETTSGIEEAFNMAGPAGPEIVPAVEISIIEGQREIHMLAYYPRETAVLERFLKILREKRFVRMEKMLIRLSNLGLPISEAELADEAKDAAPGRLHLARAMQKKAYVASYEEAFLKYLGVKRPAYEKRETFSLAETLKIISKAGATAVLAHPGPHCKPIIGRLIEAGIEGIEVFHPDHDHSLRQFYYQLARIKKLLITGGSDYHGNDLNKPYYPVQFAIQQHYLEELKKHSK